jgi:hypothetical protein
MMAPIGPQKLLYGVLIGLQGLFWGGGGVPIDSEESKAIKGKAIKGKAIKGKAKKG